MKLLALAFMAGALLAAPPDQLQSGASGSAPSTSAVPAVKTLLKIKRVYVEALAGNDSAEAIRQLIISSLQQSHLFTLTDNPDRADVTLKGAANDTAFTDTYDSDSGANGRANGGLYSGRGSTIRSAAGGIFGGMSGSENESERIRERKHEAYATVRLCNRDGDVLWATTQESRGAKFHGASEDVALKIARQLETDFAKASHAGETAPAAGNASAASNPEAKANQ
ncbi:MAG TPA: hypothetical protein VF023_05000 [Bryobacteraceae bacterium]|jgi:hypothetical protein